MGKTSPANRIVAQALQLLRRQPPMQQQQHQRRRHRVPDRNRLSLDEARQAGGKHRQVFGDQVNRRSRFQRVVHVENRKIEVQRRMIRQPILAAHLKFFRAPFHKGQRVLVRDHHALRPSRRTRSVKNVSQIGLNQIDLRGIAQPEIPRATTRQSRRSPFALAFGQQAAFSSVLRVSGASTARFSRLVIRTRIPQLPMM